MANIELNFFLSGQELMDKNETIVNKGLREKACILLQGTSRILINNMNT